MNTQKQILALSLCFSLLIICSTYVFLTSAGDGVLASAESDQVLYLQYARNMATGQPFVFTPGDAPSTGSTTYLYITLLALLYKAGLTGNLFMVASFILNSLCYMGIITAVWCIGKRMAPRALPLTMALTLMSGHTLSAVLKQTDIGFFALIALWTFAALLYGKYRLILVLAMLCAATRPEGFVFSFALFLCGCGSWALNRRRPDKQPLPVLKILLPGLCGIAVYLITLGINHHLTGHSYFMSVVSKGYFKAFPLSGAIIGTLRDTLELIKGVFFGLQEQGRQFYLLPLVAGALGLSGILLYPREKKETRLAESWLLLSAGACILLIGSSQWAGISNDRYLGWFFPLWIIYVSIGVYELADRLNARYFLPLCSGLLILYQAASLLYIGASSYSRAIALELEKKFALELRDSFPENTVLCSTAGNSINYHVPELRIKNLWGMTTPEFSLSRDGMYLHPVIELLKHDQNLRFNYWISSENFNADRPWFQPLLGERLMRDNDTGLFNEDTFIVYKTDWSPLEGGLLPVDHEFADRKLIGSFDVGHIPQEDAFDYKVNSRIKNMSFPTIATVDKLQDAEYLDVGRVIIGSEEFTIPAARIGEPLTIVLRTGRKASGDILFGGNLSSLDNLEWNEQLSLRVFADDQEVQIPAQPLNQEGFSEVVLTIPGEDIRSSSPQIKLVGDHIAYAYWFYQ